MQRFRTWWIGVCLLALSAGVRAEEPVLATVQGVIEKIDKTTVQVKTRPADGKPSKFQTFLLTGTTWVTEVSIEKRGTRLVPVQRDLELRDLHAGQTVALICTNTQQGQVVLTAVVTAPEPDRGLARDVAKAPALPRGVPEKVGKVLAFIDDHDEAPDGYEGGRRFLNLGREGEQSLPRRDAQNRPITYREWDVNPLVPGRNRGAERLVTGTDGSAWYTSDHYKTYTRVR
jgi:guanyl-specific ribonuclease Sa